MRDYAKVAPAFWQGRLARALRGDALAMAVAHYLMTSPSSNMIALYHLPPGYMAADLGFPESPFEAPSKPLRSPLARVSETTGQALYKLQELGFVQLDFERELVWVVNAVPHEFPKALTGGDNQIKAIRKLLSEVADSPLYARFLRLYGEYLGLSSLVAELPEESAEASPFEAPSKPLRSPFEAPSKPGSGSGTGDGSGTGAGGGDALRAERTPTPEIDAVLEAYNRALAVLRKWQGKPARARAGTEKTRKAISAALKEWGAQTLCSACCGLMLDPFWRGETPGGNGHGPVERLDLTDALREKHVLKFAADFAWSESESVPEFEARFTRALDSSRRQGFVKPGGRALHVEAPQVDRLRRAELFRAKAMTPEEEEAARVAAKAFLGPLYDDGGDDARD